MSSLRGKLATDNLERDLVNQIRKGVLQPGDPILPIRELTKKYRISYNTVRKVIRSLVKRNLLVSQQGKGTFVADRKARLRKAEHPAGLEQTSAHFHAFGSPAVAVYKKIRISIPVLEDRYQVAMWKALIDKFNMEYPFIEVEADFGFIDTNSYRKYDVVFIGPYELRLWRKDMVRLDGKLMSRCEIKENELCEDILKLGRISGSLYGIPVLRSASLISVNRDIMDRYDIKDSQIKRAVDVLRVGNMVGKRSKNKIMGTRYLGFIYHGAMYGIDIRRERNKLIFDKEKIKNFLEQTKPHIRKHHFRSPKDIGEELFLEGRYCIYPDFWYLYPFERESKYNMVTIRFPVEEGGFGCEGAFIGCITVGSKQIDECLLFLSFLITKEGQKAFIKHSPNWLSVRKDVLAEQKKNSPFPDGSIIYDFDIRSFYSQLDPVIFIEYEAKLNTEAGKFFMGLQGIDETIKKLEYV